MPLVRSVFAYVILVAAVFAPPAVAGEFGSEYVAQGKCGPFPRAAPTTPSWACVGIVAGPSDGLVMPRSLIEISPGRLLLTDMGGWETRTGRVIEIRLGAEDEAWTPVPGVARSSGDC